MKLTTEFKNGGALPPLPCMSSWHSAQLIKLSDNFIIPMFQNVRVSYIRAAFVDRHSLAPSM
jgi:hypothetical protein